MCMCGLLNLSEEEEKNKSNKKQTRIELQFEPYIVHN